MIGILGGGISGLFLLHLLSKSGLEAVLFESSTVAGGVMRSRILPGPDGPVTADLGPQRVRLSPGLAELLEELALTDSLLEAPRGMPFTVWHHQKLIPAPLSFREAFGTRLISWSGKVRALRDLVTPGPRPDESVASVLERKLGPEIYRRLAGPILGGLYASDPERMSARHTLVPVLRRTGSKRSLLRGLYRASKGPHAPVVSFEGGMGALPVALATRYADRVQLGRTVRTVVPSGGGKYRIESDMEAVSVDRLVVTLPAAEAAKVLRESHPTASDALASLHYNPLAVVPLVVPGEAPGPPMGSGFKMTLDEDVLTRGVTDHEALFSRKGLFTAYLGGQGREEILELPDSQIREHARRDFERVTGVGASPLFVHRTWMPAWDASWSAMEGMTLPDGVHLCAAFSSRPGILGRLEEAHRVATELGAQRPGTTSAGLQLRR